MGLLLMMRTLKKFKEYSIPGILGFSLSLSLTLLAVFCIMNEIQYDTFHKDYKNIYRVTAELIYKTGATAKFARVMPWVGPYLADEFPEVEAVARFQKPEDRVIIVNDIQFKEQKVTWVDSSFFRVFGFKLVAGNPEDAFKQLATAVVTKETAIKYFGTTDVIGKTIGINANLYNITGVVEDGRTNSHFSFNILLNSYYLTRGWPQTEVGTHRSMLVYTYVKFKEGFSAEGFMGKLKDFENRHLTAADLAETGLFDWTLGLQPITDIHIGSHMKRELDANIDAATIELISIVTLIIVIIAGFNYIVLTTAVYSRRVKEIAIQKVHGAAQKTIVAQFIRESVMFILIALCFGFVFLTIEIMLFGNLFNDGSLDLSILYNPLFLITVSILVLLIGVIGGLYPSIVFGAVKPISIFRPKKGGMGNPSFLFKLCGVQAIISIVMIGFTYLVIQQLSFFNAKDYGFDKDNLIVIFLPRQWAPYETFRNELMQNPKIVNVCQTLNYPGGFVEEGMAKAEGYQETFLMPSLDGCDNFLETMGLTVVAGRTLDKTDDWTSVVVNEAAVEKFGWKDSALGRKIYTIEERGVELPYTVVGVVKDFHYYSALERVEPFRIHVRCDRMDDILVRVEGGVDNSVIEEIRKTWLKLDANTLFDYSLVSDIYGRKYEREQKLIRVFTVFSVVAIVIAAMGFYGISSITGNSRAKEIGIRKTLGATELEIFIYIMAKFMRLIMYAVIIAVPILYIVMENWLADFAYKIEIEPTLFLVPVGIIFVIAISSFSYYVIKASRVQPSKVLKYE
jgi:putative ABC transport system permease protein